MQSVGTQPLGIQPTLREEVIQMHEQGMRYNYRGSDNPIRMEHVLSEEGFLRDSYFEELTAPQKRLINVARALREQLWIELDPAEAQRRIQQFLTKK